MKVSLEMFCVWTMAVTGRICRSHQKVRSPISQSGNWPCKSEKNYGGDKRADGNFEGKGTKRVIP